MSHFCFCMRSSNLIKSISHTVNKLFFFKIFFSKSYFFKKSFFFKHFFIFFKQSFFFKKNLFLFFKNLNLSQKLFFFLKKSNFLHGAWYTAKMICSHEIVHMLWILFLNIIFSFFKPVFMRKLQLSPPPRLFAAAPAQRPKVGSLADYDPLQDKWGNSTPAAAAPAAQQQQPQQPAQQGAPQPNYNAAYGTIAADSENVLIMITSCRSQCLISHNFNDNFDYHTLGLYDSLNHWFIHPSIDWLIDSIIQLLIDWLNEWLIDRLIDWLNDPSFHLLMDWLIGW